MRFYYSLTLSALILLYLISDNVLEASKTGKYMLVKCNPKNKNANCLTKKGPTIDLQGKPGRIAVRDLKDIFPLQSSEESFETEESGDGSGDIINRAPRDNPEEEFVMEGSTDYNNFIDPSLEKPGLSLEDMREDNVIE